MESEPESEDAMSKLKVLVLGELVSSAREKLNAFADAQEFPREEPLPEKVLIENLHGKDAVVSEPLDPITPAVMDACPSLRVVANRAVGYDNINIAEATKRGVCVTNTPGVLDNATADLAVALLLATSRRICESDRYVREGKWVGFQSDLMLGPDLWGKTCGIIGMGRIGKAFAVRARVFGLNLIYTRFSPRDEKDDVLERELGAKRVELDELLKTADFVSIHCPLNHQTRKLIGKRELELMKADSILINTARGAIIDQPALVSHLVQGKILAAGLDVFDDEPNVPAELIGMEKVVLTPHIGSACFDTRRRMAEVAIESIEAAFSGKKPNHLVNADVWEKFQKETKPKVDAR